MHSLVPFLRAMGRSRLSVRSTDGSVNCRSNLIVILVSGRRFVGEVLGPISLLGQPFSLNILEESLEHHKGHCMERKMELTH